MSRRDSMPAAEVAAGGERAKTRSGREKKDSSSVAAVPRRRGLASAFRGAWPILLVLSCLAAGPSTHPSTQPAGKYEQQTLRAPTRSRAAGPPTSQPAASLDTFDFDTKRVVIALGSVIALIVVLRLVLKRLFPQVVAPKAANVMRVLARLPINPRQQVLLLQVGRRVVVVGDCGQAMSSLGEISDPDEVTQLLSQISEDSRGNETRSFVNLFGKARSNFDEEEVGANEKHSLVSEKLNDPEEIDAARGELHGLIEKVRNLSSQMRKH